jgi:hypothetical protein
MLYEPFKSKQTCPDISMIPPSSDPERLARQCDYTLNSVYILQKLTLKA